MTNILVANYQRPCICEIYVYHINFFAAGLKDLIEIKSVWKEVSLRICASRIWNSHPSFFQSQCCLTTVFKWELVCRTCWICLLSFLFGVEIMLQGSHLSSFIMSSFNSLLCFFFVLNVKIWIYFHRPCSKFSIFVNFSETLKYQT